MIKDKITKKIALSLDAEDWELYTDMDQVDLAANALNAILESEINSGKSRSEVESAMSKFMMNTTIRNFGAADTEPMRVLDIILNNVYGE